MRGKDDEGRLKLRHVGITPAYAGKSALQLCTDSCSRDHPRVCGEKFGCSPIKRSGLGSPPRMRGKGASGRRAGSPGRDHPRVCGEKKQRCSLDRYMVGSPPRMRGKVQAPVQYPGRSGITPAYAGKSCTFQRPRWRFQDHPRVCGEKSR